MSDEIVERVLFEWYGLSRLEDLLAGKKPKGDRIRDFLKGTVLGTFSPTKDHMPHPSAIYSIPQAAVTETGNLTYVDVGPEKTLGIFREGCADLVRRHQWIMSSRSSYYRLSSEEVLASFQTLAQIIGGSAVIENVIDEKPRQSYSLTLSSENPLLWAYLQCGQRSRNHPIQKKLTLLFNANEDLVDRANKIVSRYYAFLARCEQTTDAINPSVRTGIATYPELLERQPITLADLEEKTVADYNRSLRYERGEVVRHPVFGLGLVGEIGRTTVRVYFPKERKEQMLTQGKI